MIGGSERGNKIERSEEMGTCKHGEFDLMKGCPQCIADRMAKEGNTEASIAEAVKSSNRNIVKVQYYSETSGELNAREYTYFSVDRLNVGDIVMAPVRDTTGKAMVSAVDVSPAEIVTFADKVKTIPTGSVIKVLAPENEVPVEIDEEGNIVPKVRPEQEEMEEGLQSEGLTLTKPEPVEEAEEPEIGAVSFGVEIPEGSVLVEIDPGSAPSFAKHLEAANRILEIAATREILNEDDAKLANDDLTVMLKLEVAVDEERKTFTGPLNEYVSTINGAYKLITGPLLEAKQITKRVLTVWKVEQQRKAQEAEDLNRQALEVARKQAELNQGEFTTDIKPVPVPFVAKLTRTDQGSSGLVDYWKYRVVDITQVPREYMMPNDAMLKSIATKNHDKSPVPGVEFYNDPGLRTTKR